MPAAELYRRWNRYSSTSHPRQSYRRLITGLMNGGRSYPLLIIGPIAGTCTGGQADVLRFGIQPGNQTRIDLLRGQAWLRLGRGERLCGPVPGRNHGNTPSLRRRAIENIREARCDLRPEAIKPA